MVTSGGAPEMWCEQWRIVGLADGDEAGAERASAGDLVLGLGDWMGCGTRLPARFSRPGRASSAASAEPSRLSNWRKVCGPTLSVRIRRSQAMRLRRREHGARRVAIRSGSAFFSEPILGSVPRDQPRDIGAVREIEQRSSSDHAAANATPSALSP